jgi:hypothetical protein
MFGQRSRCDLDGTSDIKVGDREPENDPATDGTLEVVGGPCNGGGCKVHPFFDLKMDDITFEVKWHSDPTFSDLKASGRGLDAALVDADKATFAAPRSTAPATAGVASAPSTPSLRRTRSRSSSRSTGRRSIAT